LIIKLFEMKSNLKRFWSSKIFKYAVFLHLFYFILSLILVLIVFKNQNDFLVFYKVGGVVLNNIQDLYNQENYLWNFRYLPLTGFFFVPFYVLGFDFGFISFHVLNLILNMLICTILYKIIILVKGENHEQDIIRVILYISLYLMSLPQMFNYVLGQINLYITFLIVLSLYIFLKFKSLKWNFIGSILLGFSIIIKPITIFMIPFLIIINYNYSEKRFSCEYLKSIIRILGSILPLSLNVIIFIFYPNLMKGFLETNFSGDNSVDLNFSFSITKIIINICYFYNLPFNQIFILSVVLIVVFSISFIIYIFGQFQQNSIIFGYFFGILVMLLGYFDSWDHHLLILTPILIILMFILDKNSQITNMYIKPSFFFFSFLDLAFMGIWFLIKTWFPYNIGSTIFLILTIYGISKYGLNKKMQRSRGDR